MSQSQTQYINIEATAKVTDFNQRFYYLACSLCNKASNVYQNTDLWCNYCAKKAPPLIRIKFNVAVADQTGSIDATVFPEIAEEIYGIIGDKIALPALGEPLAQEILHKLAEQKQGNITLKAYMYTYAGIAQLRFNVYSMCPIADPEQINDPTANPALLPPTLAKTEHPATASPSQTSPETPSAKKNKL